MIYMQPTYIRRLKQEKPKEIAITQYSPKYLDSLNASFDITDWDLFIQDAKDVDEHTDVVSEYIRFNADSIMPKKKIKFTETTNPGSLVP